MIDNEINVKIMKFLWNLIFNFDKEVKYLKDFFDENISNIEKNDHKENFLFFIVIFYQINQIEKKMLKKVIEVENDFNTTKTWSFTYLNSWVELLSGYKKLFDIF